MAAPWFKLYPADYLLDAKVDALPLEAQGILIRLWCLCARDGSIPRDVAVLARRSGVAVSVLRKHWPILLAFFEERGEESLVSPRLEFEILRYSEKVERLHLRAVKAGKASAAKRQLAPSRNDSTQVELVLSRGMQQEVQLKPTEAEAEAEITYPPPGTPCGEAPPARRGTRRGEAGKLWPTGWGEAAETELQSLLAEYPKKRPDGTRMSNGSPKELRRLWLGILQANPQVTPRLLKLCAYEHLESEHSPGVRVEQTGFVQLLSTVFGPKKASWESYLEGAMARQRAQDSGLNPEPIPLMRLQEAAHG
ncbi:MAG: DUF1376 domain-containing protein [Bacteroidetes bacterium]|nr:DUF1376 domain-containing protein [Bacteroidota bacterium]